MLAKLLQLYCLNRRFREPKKEPPVWFPLSIIVYCRNRCDKLSDKVCRLVVFSLVKDTYRLNHSCSFVCTSFSKTCILELVTLPGRCLCSSQVFLFCIQNRKRCQLWMISTCYYNVLLQRPRPNSSDYTKEVIETSGLSLFTQWSYGWLLWHDGPKLNEWSKYESLNGVLTGQRWETR